MGTGYMGTGYMGTGYMGTGYMGTGSMGYSSGEKSPEAISLPGIIVKEPLLEQDTPS
jgi:hypothetical protein